MKTMSQVAEDLGVAKTTIWHHANSMSLGKMIGGTLFLSEDDVAKISKRTLVCQEARGMVTVRQLVEETGLSRMTISKRIQRLGIKTEERRRTFLTAEQAEMVRNYPNG